jgi:hypothetical protein
VNRYLTTQAAVAAHAAIAEEDAATADDPGKQPLNILTLISELYNFQVVSCLLIYDLVKGFISDLGTSGPKGEFAVEGVLRVLRCELMAQAQRSRTNFDLSKALALSYAPTIPPLSEILLRWYRTRWQGKIVSSGMSTSLLWERALFDVADRELYIRVAVLVPNS